MPKGKTAAATSAATLTTNPLVYVDAEIADAQFGEYSGRPMSVIEKAVKEARGQMERVIAQASAGDDFDISRAEGLSGDTPKEKADSMVALHSRLAGCQRALSQAQELMASVNIINNMNRDGVEQIPEGMLIMPESRIFPIAQPVEPITARFERALAEKEIENLVALGEDGRDFQFRNLSDTSAGSLDHLYAPSAATLTLANADPAEQRLPQLIPSSQRPPQILDLIPEFRMTSDTLEWLEETTFTNSAAEIADGAAAPESALDFTLRSSRAKRTATILPVTEGLLMDVGQMGMYLDRRLPFMVRSKVDSQILLGDGTGEKLNGILALAGTNSRTIASSDSAWTHLFKDLYKAMNMVSAGGGYLNPTGWIVENSMWIEIVTQETTSAGFYYGPPGGRWENVLFGLPVRLSTSLTGGDSQKVAVVADFNQMALGTREGFSVEMGRSGTDFAEFQYTFRAWHRGNMAYYNPKGITIISTGANSPL